MTTTYYSIDGEPDVVLRRIKDEHGIVDQAWRDGRWQPTKRIVDYMFGHDNDVALVPESAVPAEVVAG